MCWANLSHVFLSLRQYSSKCLLPSFISLLEKTHIVASNSSALLLNAQNYILKFASFLVLWHFPTLIFRAFTLLASHNNWYLIQLSVIFFHYLKQLSGKRKRNFTFAYLFSYVFTFLIPSQALRCRGEGGWGREGVWPPKFSVDVPFSSDETFKCVLFEISNPKCTWKSTSKITSSLKSDSHLWKNFCFVCFIESPLKIMKNAFFSS